MSPLAKAAILATTWTALLLATIAFAVANWR